MHELALAENILEIVKGSMSANGGGKLKSVKVRVGELAGVVPESLDFCFTALINGTEMESAKLEVERCDIVAHCLDCGTDSIVDGMTFKCAACGGGNVKVISGNELQVIEIEVEDECDNN